jgi:hypothetical protein
MGGGSRLAGAGARAGPAKKHIERRGGEETSWERCEAGLAAKGAVCGVSQAEFGGQKGCEVALRRTRQRPDVQGRQGQPGARRVNLAQATLGINS